MGWRAICKVAHFHTGDARLLWNRVGDSLLDENSILGSGWHRPYRGDRQRLDSGCRIIGKSGLGTILRTLPCCFGTVPATGVAGRAVIQKSFVDSC
jgi:hypothetical protein